MGEFENEDDARGYKTREANHAELKVRDAIHKRLNPMLLKAKFILQDAECALCKTRGLNASCS
jgi:hypothetical protein